MNKGLSDKIEEVRDYLESQGCSPEEIDRRLFNSDEYDGEEEDNDIDKFFDKITEKAEIEGIKNKIRNSLRAYIIGDALGVPFEFKTKGTFNCTDFVGGGTHGQEAGTWSEETSVMLCMLDALTRSGDIDDAVELFKENLKDWYYRGTFSVDGTFDVGKQIKDVITCDFTKWKTIYQMGNGALFYAPVAYYFLNEEFEENDFRNFCEVTHFKSECFYYGWKFGKMLIDNIQGHLKFKREFPFHNKGDVINTYSFVVFHFSISRNSMKNASLFECLCNIVNDGEDTDTNAALLGLLLGTEREVNKKDWLRIRKHEFADEIIDAFIEKIPGF